jgi:large subunit ribosomal protein L1
MGKIRIKTFGDEGAEEAEKQKKALKRAEKKARESIQEKTGEDIAEQPDQITESVEPAEKSSDQAEIAKPKKAKKEKFLKKTNRRSAAYLEKVMEIDKDKAYPINEGLVLLRKVKIAKFDETVELHINTTEAGISGQVKLPHGNGKEIKVAVADDSLISEIEKGKLDFDILISSPSFMPKLARVARVLGPKGLMPNPKNGTISENPEEAMKKFQGGQINFKTESKNPIIHLSIGKTSFEDKKLEENIITIIKAIKKDRIRNITLKSTMSPGIKLTV